MIRRPLSQVRRRRRGVGLALLVTGGVAFVARHGGGTSVRVAAPAISRVFHAAGGPMTAVVIVAAPGSCEVDLVGPHGVVLDRGWAGASPLTLGVSAAAGTALSLVLHVPGGRAVSWQAELRGAHA